MATRLSGRRCAIDATALTPQEDVVGRSIAPYLYGATNSPEGEPHLHGVLDATIAYMLANQGKQTSAEAQSVRRFWARFLSRATITKRQREDVVQHYLFHFWDDAAAQKREHIRLEDSFIPQAAETWDAGLPLSLKLMQRFRDHAPVDIVARSGTALCIVEVKYGQADDRTVGQLLRYFEAARTIISRVDHRCDLRSVMPVLVVSDFPPQQWPALPTAFRELLQLRCYRPTPDGEFTLDDGKPLLINFFKGHQRLSY